MEEVAVRPVFGALGFLGGLFTSLGMFGVGIATAAWFLAAEPVREVARPNDADRLWTLTPRKVDVAAQDFERLPPATPAPVETTAQGIDVTTTASLPSDPPSVTVTEAVTEEDSLRADVDFAAHVEWCQRRYRSYRLNDNSYTSYDGDDRPCVSPYSEELLAPFPEPASATLSGEAVPVQHAMEAQYAMDNTSGVFDEDHVNSCFARYRSYRASDNSYQPYGSGPRRQCR